jgi:hypothetical protein
MSISTAIVVNATCFRCGSKFDYLGEFPYGYHFDPKDEYSDWIACRPCALKLGDDTMHNCVNCNVQFQELHRGIFSPEGCSPECSNQIDYLVEMAEQRALDREQSWLESYGQDESDDVPDSDWTDEDRAESRIQY